MGGVLLQVTREIYDVDGLKRTFLRHIRSILDTPGRKWRELTLVQMPQPMQRVSEIVASLSVGTTSIQSFPA